MLWEALGRAGWIGEMVSIRTTVSLRLAVAAAPASRPGHRSRLEPLPGGVRRLGERGWVDDDGVRWQQFVGPLNGRAAGPGYRLLESERRPEELEFGEDMLYTAAVHAGWLRDEPGGVSDIPDVRIAVAVASRNPSWENPVEPAAISPHPDVVPVPAARSADERQSQRAAKMPAAIDERQLLALALEVAARNGDPEPELIQLARGSRYELTRTTGSVLFSDAPSYIVVMKGNFRAPRPHPAGPSRLPEVQLVSYPFQILVSTSRPARSPTAARRINVPTSHRWGTS